MPFARLPANQGIAMQDVTKNTDQYSLQYYVITPRDRVRLEALLAPVSLRHTEHIFKTILNDSFMAKTMEYAVMDRIRFCAFRHALGIVRATPEGTGLTFGDKSLLEQSRKRLERYVGIIRDYEAAYEEALSPLQKKDLTSSKIKTSSQKAYKTICEIGASERAKHHTGITILSAEQLKTVESALNEFKAKLIVECFPDILKSAHGNERKPQTFLNHLKPW
jgi:hypothetical protein